MKFKLGLLLATILVLLVFAFPVFALTTIDSLSIYCDQIQISYTSTASLGQDEAIITITNNDTGIVIYQTTAGSLLTVFSGSYTINFPAQAAGSNLTIDLLAGLTDSGKGPCSVRSGAGAGGNAPDYQAIAFGDGRFCFGRGEAEAALFPFGDGLVIYRLNGETGVVAILLNAAALLESQATNFLLAASADNYIRLYRLNSGQLQVNVGPDAEGKVHVCIFRSIPDSTAQTFSYFVD